MRILKIIFVIFCITLLVPQTINACGEILSKGELWESDGKAKAEARGTLDTRELRDASSQIYNILLIAATVVALFVGMFLGIKFMTAGIDKKVQVKEALFPYLISCIVVFGSLGIWKLAVTIMNEIK